MNTAWHEKHPLPLYAKEDEQVAWHLAHAKVCGCRPIPAWIRRRAERKQAKGRRKAS
ncbi:MAG TPA: hypothetical protein VMB50_17875 [Myxococcales bacterium]|nr:hypothetical protein [Myxococcales bacterium]